MSSAFSGIDIAYRALQAQQAAVDVVNHNIANANTPGYSRQAIHLAASPPSAISSLNRNGAGGQTGTGVVVSDIRRSRYGFVDYQIRNESQTLGQWAKTRDALKQVEVVFNEPSDSGLNAILSKFWQAWQDLANAPQDAGTRRALVEQADSLTVTFNRKHSQLTSIQQDLDGQLGVGVAKVNELAERVVSLNAQIAAVELVGQRANDLRDQRDLVLDELSQLTRITYYEGTRGDVSVFIGSHPLVSGTRAEALSVVQRLAGSDDAALTDVVWEDTLTAASITDGELYGLLRARDNELPQFIGDLQSLAGELMSRVNELHRGGFGLDNGTGIDFFSGSNVSDMSVNPTLKANPEKVASAGSMDASGDSSVALAIAGLRRDQTMNGGTADFGKFFASMISRLGVNSQRADMMAANQKLLVDHLNRHKLSVSGVSLDEEAIHLIEYQRAYQAASRVVNAVDEMLDRLINGTGLVGR